MTIKLPSERVIQVDKKQQVAFNEKFELPPNYETKNSACVKN